MHEYCSPKLALKEHPDKGGYGLFAREPVAAGEVLLVWGGAVTPWEVFQHLSPDVKRYSIQVEEELFLVPQWPPEVPAFINHSCDPNAGLCGQITLVAMRDIAAGEEICYDYAMSDGLPYDEFECHCGAPTCRGRVTGDDWRRPELWVRYAGYFSPYLQRRIYRLLGLSGMTTVAYAAPLAARRFCLIAVAAAGKTEVEARTRALAKAGLGNASLLPVFPVIPAIAKRATAARGWRGSPVVPAAYTWATSSAAGEPLALALAVAWTDLGYGVVLAAQGRSEDEAVAEVNHLASTLLHDHWRPGESMEVIVARAPEGPVSCVFAACLYL